MQDRATVYLRAGIPVHLRGPSGTGKSTLALQIAARLGRPIAMLSGDHGVSSKDIIGKEGGTRTRRVVDKFIHNVQKQETETTTVWTDSVLTSAVVNGYTLFYDEFTRSPPEANNAFLMALEERRLLVPSRTGSESYIPAHPEFRAIFTSNPEDYAGVQTPQDALIDRMITLEVAEQERETEIGIVCARTGISTENAGLIVDLIRTIRAQASHRSASLRSAIMIASVLVSEGIPPEANEPAFVQLCVDALFVKWAAEGQNRHRKDFVAEVVKALAQNDEGED
ncbi:MAG: gas vesicle protein GvpN [Parvularculaceae bacterium]|nr:gas vesicle protein GvpN [Parvularculaceae bacterium]